MKTFFVQGVIVGVSAHILNSVYSTLIIIAMFASSGSMGYLKKEEVRS